MDISTEASPQKSRSLRSQLLISAMACLIFQQAGSSVNWMLDAHSVALVYAPFAILLAATWLPKTAIDGKTY